MNHELIELHNNFLQFNLLHKEDESEKEILTRVKKQWRQILERMKELKADNDHLFLSREETGSYESILHENETPQNTSPIESKSRPSKTVPQPTESTVRTASDEKESRYDPDIELEQECNHCSLIMDHPFQIKEEDRVYINWQVCEVLIFPTDESLDENWTQGPIINKKNIWKP